MGLKKTVYVENIHPWAIIKNLTNVVRGADDLANLLGVLDHPGDLEVAEFDLTVGELAHQHDVLRLK